MKLSITKMMFAIAILISSASATTVLAAGDPPAAQQSGGTRVGQIAPGAENCEAATGNAGAQGNGLPAANGQGAQTGTTRAN